MRLTCLVLCLSLSGLLGTAQAESTEQIKARQAQARTERTELQAAIRTLHKQIESTESTRKEAVTELKASEQAISEAGRRLSELGAAQAALDKEIDALQQQAGKQRQALSSRQEELAKQLQTQYATGLSPWAALLSGDDPQAISRELGYLSYVSQAQADAIRRVRLALDELAQSETRLQARQQEQAKVTAEVAQQKRTLEKQHAERERVLIRISGELREQRNESDALKRDEQRLGKLVQGLEATLARQEEQARLAAEQARKAAAERQRQEQQRRQEQAERARLQAEQEARAAREQVEQASRGAAQQPETPEPAPPAVVVAPPPPPAPPPPEPVQEAVGEAVQAGLRKGLAYPVRGEVQGRFGAQRPDGGTWRGVVLRANEGVPVKAIASGKVVYANWLKGFGNMIIVDHGQQYMSIYAYNQSLLKSVGDAVSAGEAVALVGATGGQVESGLYFEIRHQGAPVNPLLWLRQ